LSVNARRLRKTLNDDANAPTFIETIARRGYRFIAEVRCVEATGAINGSVLSENTIRFPGLAVPPLESSQPPSRTQPNPLRIVGAAAAPKLEIPNEDVPEIAPAARQAEVSHFPKVGTIGGTRRKRTAIFAASGLGLFVIAAVALVYYLAPRGATPTPGTRSIAVLPLKPINAANRDVYVEMGIADALINKLSSMKGFVIRPLSATRKYADVAQDPLAAGSEQRVDYVLDSNYQLADGKIRITAQLFNIATGQVEETYKSQTDAGNIFAMQDAIARDVGSMFLARFATSAGNSTAKRQTSNEEAYHLYLQGMYLYDKRNIADARKAVEFLEQAVTLDPNYAQAWAWKAHAHRTVSSFGRSANVHDEYRKSTEAINRALSLDEGLADAHSALCENIMSYEYDLEGAGRECLRAVELDPNSSLSHHIYGRYLMSRGRFDEATAELKIAIDLDPASIFNHFVYGVSFIYSRRYDEAVAQLKRVIEMDRNVSAAYPWLLSALALQGNRTEPFDLFEKFPEQFVAGEPTAQVYKSAYQASGWEGVFREWVKRFDEIDMGFCWGAFANAQIGNTEKAFEYLEKSYQRREWGLALLQVDPRFDSIRGDPRFDDMVRRVESK
jgi:TolB-like protein/Tfp pilus assembly protein PilF